MFVALKQPKYIWQLLTEVDTVNLSLYSYNTVNLVPKSVPSTFDLVPKYLALD
jgi:hypothetical protein